MCTSMSVFDIFMIFSAVQLILELPECWIRRHMPLHSVVSTQPACIQ